MMYSKSTKKVTTLFYKTVNSIVYYAFRGFIFLSLNLKIKISCIEIWHYLLHSHEGKKLYNWTESRRIILKINCSSLLL